jgi:hypothetical protein
MNGVCGQTFLPNVPMRTSSFASFINDAKPVIEPFTVSRAASGFAPGASARIVGTARVGRTVRCQAPKLAGDPSKLSYGWSVPQNTRIESIRGAHKQTLKITSALYRKALPPKLLFCTATARNAGGTLSLMSPSTRLKNR